jgi:hypothetical protein
MKGTYYVLKLYKCKDTIDSFGAVITHKDDSHPTNPTRAKGLADTCASTHGGRITNWFYGGPYPESGAFIHSDSLDIPGHPDAHFRVFHHNKKG